MATDNDNLLSKLRKMDELRSKRQYRLSTKKPASVLVRDQDFEKKLNVVLGAVNTFEFVQPYPFFIQLSYENVIYPAAMTFTKGSWYDGVEQIFDEIFDENDTFYDLQVMLYSPVKERLVKGSEDLCASIDLVAITFMNADFLQAFKRKINFLYENNFKVTKQTVNPELNAKLQKAISALTANTRTEEELKVEEEVCEVEVETNLAILEDVLVLEEVMRLHVLLTFSYKERKNLPVKKHIVDIPALKPDYKPTMKEYQELVEKCIYRGEPCEYQEQGEYGTVIRTSTLYRFDLFAQEIQRHMKGTCLGQVLALGYEAITQTTNASVASFSDALLRNKDDILIFHCMTALNHSNLPYYNKPSFGSLDKFPWESYKKPVVMLNYSSKLQFLSFSFRDENPYQALINILKSQLAEQVSCAIRLDFYHNNTAHIYFLHHNQNNFIGYDPDVTTFFEGKLEQIIPQMFEFNRKKFQDYEDRNQCEVQMSFSVASFKPYKVKHNYLKKT